MLLKVGTPLLEQDDCMTDHTLYRTLVTCPLWLAFRDPSGYQPGNPVAGRLLSILSSSIFCRPFVKPHSALPILPPKSPLRLLPLLEFLQNPHLPFQRIQPLTHSRLRLRLIPHLGIKVLLVRRGGHGGAEDRFHHEGMMRFQGAGVGGAEGGGELGVGVLEGVTEGLGGEIEAADEPEETFGGSVLFGF